MSRWPLVLTLLTVFPAFTYAQVSIREVCASNIDLVLDEDGSSSDWIELFNESAFPVDLSRWRLSDDPNDPLAWTLPNLTLQPSERLFIWASGKGTNHPYTPHYQPLVTQGSEGAYFPGTIEPPSTWRDVDFDDSTWSTGPSGFGFGDNDDATVVSSPTVYVRHEFKVEAKQIRHFNELYLHVDFDDGYIAYLNGHEISRENMSGAPGTHAPASSPASGGHEALLYQGGELSAIQLAPISSHLRAGDNVLALQVHNISSSSSDLSLIAFLTATTANPTGVLPHTGLRFKDVQDAYELHTNYKLSADGEVLTLTNHDGVEVD
ncbi:MAG: lamin tail domain-containing protein, partial [Planctomycetes bacterium]|nr:lamin tail domain-containing protein [Planctomycetota bacterium]